MNRLVIWLTMPLAVATLVLVGLFVFLQLVARPMSPPWVVPVSFVVGLVGCIAAAIGTFVFLGPWALAVGFQ